MQCARSSAQDIYGVLVVWSAEMKGMKLIMLLLCPLLPLLIIPVENASLFQRGGMG